MAACAAPLAFFVFRRVLDLGRDERHRHRQRDVVAVAAAHYLHVLTHRELVNQLVVDVLRGLVHRMFQPAARPVAAPEGGVVGHDLRHLVNQFARAAPGIRIHDDVLVRVEIAHRLADVRLGGFDGDSVHRHQLAVDLRRAASGNLEADGLDQFAAAKADADFTGHQLHLVKVMVQGPTQILLTPAGIFAADALRDSVAQAIGMADAFALHNFYREILDELPCRFRHHNIASHTIPCFLSAPWAILNEIASSG